MVITHASLPGSLTVTVMSEPGFARLRRKPCILERDTKQCLSPLGMVTTQLGANRLVIRSSQKLSGYTGIHGCHNAAVYLVNQSKSLWR